MLVVISPVAVSGIILNVTLRKEILTGTLFITLTLMLQLVKMQIFCPMTKYFTLHYVAILLQICLGGTSNLYNEYASLYDLCI